MKSRVLLRLSRGSAVLVVVAGLSALSAPASAILLTPVSVVATFPTTIVAGTSHNFTATFTVSSGSSGPSQLPNAVGLYVTRDTGGAGTISLNITSVSADLGTCDGAPYTVTCPWTNAAASDTATVSGTISASYDASGPGHIQLLWSDEATSTLTNIGNKAYTVEPPVTAAVSPTGLSAPQGGSTSFATTFAVGADVSGSSLPTGVTVSLAPESGGAGTATAVSMGSSGNLSSCQAAAATINCTWNGAGPSATASLTQSALFSADATGTWDVQWTWQDSMAGSVVPDTFTVARIVVTGVEPAQRPIATLSEDVTGDADADLIDVYPNATYVRVSTGTGFSAPEVWSNQPFYGTKATLAAGVDADNWGDLVAMDDDGIWAMHSTGTAFGTPGVYLSVPMYGTRANIAGHGVIDRIEAVDDSTSWTIGIVVHSRTAIRDSATPFYGHRTTLLGDFSGDGYLDLIAVNSDSTWVMPTMDGRQSPLLTPELTSTGAFYGTRGTFAGDVDGDGKADLIAVDDASTWLLTAGSTSFGPPHRVATQPFFGTRATLAADVNGDGKTDLVAVNDASIWVMTSTGSGFNLPASWG